MITTVLFDLDGTLSDSAPGIIGSLRRAFTDAGVAPLSDEAARPLLGPPFYESLPPIVGTDLLPTIIDRYRVHYASAKFDTSAYDGIRDVLADLRRRGVRMALATSKPEVSARPIVEHLDLAGFFVTIGGDTPDGGRGTKALVIGEVLSRLGGPDPATVLMVGDRAHDVIGAAAHGIQCLGAGWGYALPGELPAAGAVEVFAAPRDLLAAHDRLLAGEPHAASA